MENCGIEKSDHIISKLYILPRSVCYSRWIHDDVTDILENKVTYPKK